MLVTCEVSGPGRLPAGCIQIPFELPLKPRPNRNLYETYHGVFVNISYSLRCDIKRSFLSKDLQKTQQFLVQYRPKPKEPKRPVPFNITPASLASGASGAPDFILKGCLDSTKCNLESPFTGHVILEHCAVPVRSLELQLVRVETCGCAEGYAKEGSLFCFIYHFNLCCLLQLQKYRTFKSAMEIFHTTLKFQFI